MILLDTHVLIWDLAGEARLGPRAKAAIDRALAAGELALSAISFWEVAMLHARGRIQLTLEASALRRQALTIGVQEIPVTGDLAVEAGSLTALHGDPADRIIVATALKEQATLVTADERLLRWKRTLRRLDARR